MSVERACRAVVFSGGGGRGAYEVGAYEALVEAKLHPHVVCGTSVGAITASFIGAGARGRDMERVWTRLTARDVMRPRHDVLGVRHWSHVLDPAPLRSLLETHLDFERLRASKIDVRVVAVNVRTGLPRVFLREELTVDHVLASCAVPVAFPFVMVDGEPYWDGGVVANSPVRAAIEAGATEVFVVTLTPLASGGSLAPPASLVESIARAWDLSHAGNLRADIEWVSQRNALVRAGVVKGTEVRVHVVGPKEALNAQPALHFDPEESSRFVERGRSDARFLLRASLEQVAPVVA